MRLFDFFCFLVNEMPVGKKYQFKLYGSSMQPLLKSGSILFAVKLNITDYSVGDIILFKDNNSIIVHRIIEIKENVVITKGDNVLIPDPPILKTDILGKVLV